MSTKLTWILGKGKTWKVPEHGNPGILRQHFQVKEELQAEQLGPEQLDFPGKQSFYFPQNTTQNMENRMTPEGKNEVSQEDRS